MGIAQKRPPKPELLYVVPTMSIRLVPVLELIADRIHCAMLHLEVHLLSDNHLPAVVALDAVRVVMTQMADLMRHRAFVVRSSRPEPVAARPKPRHSEPGFGKHARIVFRRHLRPVSRTHRIEGIIAVLAILRAISIRLGAQCRARLGGSVVGAHSHHKRTETRNGIRHDAVVHLNLSPDNSAHKIQGRIRRVDASTEIVQSKKHQCNKPVGGISHWARTFLDRKQRTEDGT